MSKFKIKMKLTGLELEIEGSKEDIPLITSNLAAQIGGLLGPAGNIAVGAEGHADRQAINVTPTQATPKAARPKKQAARRVASAAQVAGSDLFEWVHDTSAWGNPMQTWNTATKGMWLLYVAARQNVTQEMTATQIANTFNKLFRQFGTIDKANVSRDLGKARTTAPAKLNADTTKTPANWFLTDEGIRYCEGLVATARNPQPANT